MAKLDADPVHLHEPQAVPPDRSDVHLRPTQEDTKMLKPEVVARIRELADRGLGSKRIARLTGVARNSVRRYLAGATVGHQERPAARRLDEPAPRAVHDLFGTVAAGNAVVIPQELAPGVSTSSSAPSGAPSPPSARSGAPRPWPPSGSRPRRGHSRRSTSAGRWCGSPAGR